jgi:hypothetical protein
VRKRGINWFAVGLGLLGALFIFALILVPRTCHAQTRYYWPTSIDTLWVGHQKHTHVAVTGRVAYTRTEDDGDLHIRLNSLTDSTKFVIAECIPALPCARPVTGRIITVRGISRLDVEHGWRECHPVENWSYQ